MPTDTKIGKMQENDPRLDATCKEFLSNKAVLALLLEECVPEYRGYSREEIMRCIEGDVEPSSEVVDQVPIGNIVGHANDDTAYKEGLIRYDVKFTAVAPDGTGTTIIINVEAQNDATPGYSIHKRAAYYASRMISAQKGTFWRKSEYKVHKVYSIWLCIQPNEKYRNFINHYKVVEQQVYGSKTFKPETYEDFNFVIVGLDNADSTNEMIKALSLYFGPNTSQEEKLDAMENVGVPKSAIREEVAEMCEYSKIVRAEGEAKGRAEGEAKGRAEGEMTGKAESVFNLMRNGNMEFETAVKMLGYSDIANELKPIVVSMSNNN